MIYSLSFKVHIVIFNGQLQIFHFGKQNFTLKYYCPLYKNSSFRLISYFLNISVYLTGATSLTHSGNAAPLDAVYAPTRKRFKASRDEEEILRRDQQANEAMARAYERATQFNTTLKAIINWHEKHQ